jgi:hypothetical protein
MDAIKHQLLNVLEKIDRPGTFCTSGPLPPIFPGLEVAGVGPVALPLENRQAAILKKRARQAPYGKGTRTLVDTNVRRVWEIDADQVVIANPQWHDVLKHAVEAVQADLGLEKQELQAHLYKLLLYEPGSFFRPHRDGEKLDRMVATLVIALPSVHEGGALAVRHDGRETTVDFSPHSRFQAQFAAFYADCEHEIRPVTSGFRLALIYNLTLPKSKRTITAPTSREQIAAAAAILRQWKSEPPGASDADDAPSTSRLAVLLDHHYTQAGLTRDALKGVDRARADVLFAAAREAGCDAALALVTYWEYGSAEPSGDYGYGYGRRRRYDWDDDDADLADGEHVMGEVVDKSLTAGHFSDADRIPMAYGQIPLDEDDVVSKQPLNAGEPDKEDFEGYTGNAGMTLERWYHHAAVVLWPAESRFDVLCEAGMDAASGGLELMVRHWKEAPANERESLKQSCIAFASRIIAHWPQRNFASGHHANNNDEDGLSGFDDDYEEDEDFDDEGEDRGSLVEADSLPDDRTATKVEPRTLLSLLDDLGDVSLIVAWIGNVLAKDVSVNPGKPLGDVCKRHVWTTFQHALLKVFDGTSNETLERHVRLLADWSVRKDKDVGRKKLCVQLASRMMSAVECWNPAQTKGDWRARVVDRRALLPPLVQTFFAVEEPELLARLVTYVLKRPEDFNLTRIQVPALLDLETWLKRNVKHTSSALNRWLMSVFRELETREAHPPQGPADWRRNSATGCDCADCKQLSRFLADPTAQTLRLPLPEQRRRHLHEKIERNQLDTTHVTERKGRPYTLVCTKTKASYERALKAHQLDLDQLAKIRKLLDWHRGLQASPSSRKAGRKTV